MGVILKNLVKKYGRIKVLHNINLEINDGEFAVLVGPSGCGKTTTLRMIAGLEDITEGTIIVNDKTVNNIPPKDRNIAMVFQNYALYPHMNIFNNLSFGLKLRRLPKDEIRKKVIATAKILNIDEYLGRKPSELSGGQRQRVAMGRAIIRDPEIFLFDEPLSNLDAKLRTQMRLEIKQLHHRLKNTIIYVTHDQVEAMTLGDRIVVMRDGYIEQVGTPIELFEHPKNKFVAGFIGNPPMNFTEGRIVKEDSGFCILLNNKLKIPVPEKQYSKISDAMDVIMGIRPDDISLTGNITGQNIWETNGYVEVMEPLGNETHIHLNIAGLKFTGINKNRAQIKQKEVEIAFNLDHLHVFDAGTTESVY